MNDYLISALALAEQSMPVFPCNPRNKAPLLVADKDVMGKKIKGSGGVKKAVTAPVQIQTWWKRWPQAMVGMATGHDRVFVLDFDPRVDAKTGEVFDLLSLKAALEAQMGCKLPQSRTAMTPSGGVHVWLRWPDDDGDPIRNRGNLPEHVDVRGLGGYVIAPPSVMEDGLKYRWMKARGPEHDVADAPAILVEILRSKKQRKPAAKTQTTAHNGGAPSKPTSKSGQHTVEEAIEKYAEAAMLGELKDVRGAGSGQRNAQLNTSAFSIATLVAAGALNEGFARSMLEAAARDNAGRDDDSQLSATIDSGWTAGMDNPRDLSEVADRFAERKRSWENRRSHQAFQKGDEEPPADRFAPIDDASVFAPSSAAPGPILEENGQPTSQQGRSALNLVPEGGWGADLTRECGFMAQTDQGNLERFVARFGGDFRYVDAWGWLAWDGKRWNRDLAGALLGRAIRVTMRAIEEEAENIAATGALFEGMPSDRQIGLISERMGNIDWYYRTPSGEYHNQYRDTVEEADVRHVCDRIVDVKATKKVVGTVVLFSDKVRAWGQTSESGGHIGCLNKPEMLQAELVATSDDFDVDPLKLNVLNGTLCFMRSGEAGGKASVILRAHNRADMITLISNAAYDPEAKCPVYDGYIHRVQPDAQMRDFLRCWSGYNMLGDVNAQVFALFYGQGANGKSVWVDVHAHILGDYSRVCGIETFIDQGRYRKGSDATPDLAALAGRRMVRASEPEEGTKFSDGLIKALTGTEPMPVRELNKPPFEMVVSFKCTVSANVKPRIGTDHGIQRRVRLVPWDVIIPDEEQDLLLLTKIKAEADGILARMVEGAVSYLTDSLPLPDAIAEATREYKEENDLLGRFITDCIGQAKGGLVGATPLWELFCAWQYFVNEIGVKGKPWSIKYLGGQMRKKGYISEKSSSMVWHDIELKKGVSDFPSASYSAPQSAPDRKDYLDDDDYVPL